MAQKNSIHISWKDMISDDKVRTQQRKLEDVIRACGECQLTNVLTAISWFPRWLDVWR